MNSPIQVSPHAEREASVRTRGRRSNADAATHAEIPRIVHNHPMSSMQPERLTWTALLGRWVQFAQASLALPRDAEGDRWRQSVPSIIALQAVTFALADLDRMAGEERSVAIDKAEILVRDHVRLVERIWSSDAVPMLIRELCQDAGRALQAAENKHGSRSNVEDQS
jgi:hypothetical protein